MRAVTAVTYGGGGVAGGGWRWVGGGIRLKGVYMPADDARVRLIIIIIIMYIYHALINALSAHMIQINLNRIFYTHVKHSPTKTIYIKCYNKM